MASLQDRFRTLDRAEAPDLWIEMVARASAAGALAPTRHARGMPALAMALLVTALLVVATLAAVAVGGFLRTDAEATRPFSFMGPIGVCDQVAMSEGVTLWASSHDGSTEPLGEPAEITVYDDGQVIRGPSALWGGSSNTIDAAWATRQLDPEGLSTLVESVSGSVPTCRQFPGDDYATVQTRTGGGVHVVGVGPDPMFETRVASESEVAAVTRLLADLADPDLGLTSSAWADPDWLPYVPERWRIQVAFSPLAERDYPSADGIVLPDGGTLREFGADRADTDASGTRCFTTSAAEAAQVASQLRAASVAAGTAQGFQWSFADDAGYIHVSAAGLLPHEPDCDDAGGAAPSPAADGGATPPPEPDPATVEDACDHLDPAVVSEELGEVGDLEHHVAWNGDWHMCWYPIAGDGALIVTSSRLAVPAERAAEQVRILFGDPGQPVEIAGHEVYFNSCDDTSCRSAMALTADPHFVVVTWVGGDIDPLLIFAEHILETIDRAD